MKWASRGYARARDESKVQALYQEAVKKKGLRITA
jgi:hypothetical protein